MSQSTSPSPVITNRDTNGRREADLAERGDLHELETLFGLWKAAGRSVNLWDWLEGFRSATLEATDVAKPVEKTSAEVEPPEAETNGTTRKSRRKREAATSPDDQTLGHEEMDEETSARLHAIFIRFCEEARMLGLVRSRGKGIGRRGDEVVRGILMV
jgi:hypothetical protein